MIKNLTSAEARKFVQDGFFIRRKAWDECRKVRVSHAGDYDFISNFDLEGILVEDCKRHCDCQISVYLQNPEDNNATDWEVIERMEESNPAAERSVATGA